MYRIEKLAKLFMCKICQAEISKPIILPCGQSICKKHLDTLFNGVDKFECSLCLNEHFKQEPGFFGEVIMKCFKFGPSKCFYVKSFSFRSIKILYQFNYLVLIYLLFNFGIFKKKLSNYWYSMWLL
jgi:hypothetical protein